MFVAQLFLFGEFQRKIEGAAYAAGGSTWRAPCQLLGDFIIGRKSESLGSVEPTFSNGYAFADLNSVLPTEVAQALKEGMPAFGKKINLGREEICVRH